MRDPKHPRQFTEEFRRQIVALVDSGKPRAEVMREYDLGKSTLDRWIQRVRARGSTAAADNRAPPAEPPHRARARERQAQDGGRRLRTGGADIRAKVTVMAASAGRCPISAQRRVLGVPRPTCYHMPAGPPAPPAPVITLM